MYMDNALLEKSLKFAARIVKLHLSLVNEKREPVISEQIIHSATSIGVLINEANCDINKKNYIPKLEEALEFAAETEYWLRLLILTGYIGEVHGQTIISDCDEIQQMLTNAINSAEYTDKKSALNPWD